MKQEWIEYFDENGYRLTENDSLLKIVKKNPGQPIFIYILIFLCVPLIILLTAYKVFLLLILLLFIPFVYTKWNLPFKIIIDKNRKVTTIGDYDFNFDSIKEIKVNEDVRLSDTSPFKEGYEDFVYEFKLFLNTGKVEKTFELWFRESMEEEMDDLAAYLNLYFGKKES